MLPRPADIGQAVRHVGWLFGLAKQPRFDRFSYWEKFDYWAVFWGMVIIGGTGLILYNPFVSSRYMPGWGLNVALWVHRLEAILDMGHVFIIHFFVAHLRRSNFPMDLAMFAGSVDLDQNRHERAAWVERLEAEGRLEAVTATSPAPAIKAIYYLFGYVVVVGCVFLLIGGLVNAPLVTW